MFNVIIIQMYVVSDDMACVVVIAPKNIFRLVVANNFHGILKLSVERFVLFSFYSR